MRNWRAFWLLRGFILDLGGWGFAVLFYSVLDKIDGQFVLPSPPNQGREIGAFWLLCGFILDLGSRVWGRGDGGLLCHFVLSKIVASQPGH